MTSSFKPLYLFADSQLLFWKENGQFFLESIKANFSSAHPKAAYLGASNGDQPEFFAMFQEAMSCAGIEDCRMVTAAVTKEDLDYLDKADLILLAGGDVELGWKAYSAKGLKAVLGRRYSEGAVIIGVSAGAVQLGRYGIRELGPDRRELFETFSLVPYLIDAHDERNDWLRLKNTLSLLGHDSTAIGIPTGGGLIYYPDQGLEPVRHAVDEFRHGEGGIERNILMPE